MQNDNLEVMIYGKTAEATERAKKILCNFLDVTFVITEHIDHPSISNLSSKDEMEVQDMAKQGKVIVDIDRSTIQVTGEASKLQEVKNQIVDKLSLMEKRSNEANQFYQIVKWRRVLWCDK